MLIMMRGERKGRVSGVVGGRVVGVGRRQGGGCMLVQGGKEDVVGDELARTGLRWGRVRVEMVGVGMAEGDERRGKLRKHGERGRKRERERGRRDDALGMEAAKQ